MEATGELTVCHSCDLSMSSSWKTQPMSWPLIIWLGTVDPIDCVLKIPTLIGLWYVCCRGTKQNMKKQHTPYPLNQGAITSAPP